MRDPICGMDVEEKGAQHYLQVEHETIYFCSNHCRDIYAHNKGLSLPEERKGVVARFLEKLAKNNNQSFGGTPPSCH